MPDEIQVHVIDDDVAVRDSLGFLFAAAGLKAQLYESPLAFLDIAPGLEGGCVVTDVRMPEMSGLDLVRRLQAVESMLPVVVITGHGDVPLAVEAMKLGAVDFIEKPFEDEVLLAAVRTALKGGRADGASENDPDGRLSQLSLRERQVLEGLVRGHANKIIARDLGISPRTVEIYRAKVMTKMGAETFADLIRLALSAGVVGVRAD
ncbi:MAG: response regulator [Proteobacteria bacterium]|nr:response regulator [Pseudomonadota bacterium]